MTIISSSPSGALDTIFSLQGDPSLFVASVAGQLLAHILALSLHNAQSTEWPPSAMKITAYLEESLRSLTSPRVTQAFHVLTTTLGHSHGSWMRTLWAQLSPLVAGLLAEDPVPAAHDLVDLLLSVAWSGLGGSFGGGQFLREPELLLPWWGGIGTQTTGRHTCTQEVHTSACM